MLTEQQLINIIFLLADTQQWLSSINNDLLKQLPLKNNKKLFRKSYYLSVTAMAHIIERHYYKINRHPGCGKFTIPIEEILHFIIEAYQQPSFKIKQTANIGRIYNTEKQIGIDHNGTETTYITVIANHKGDIITAFPGILENQ